MHTHRTDYAIGGLVGFFAGIFLIPVLINIGNQGNTILKSYPVLMLAPWVMAVAIVFGVWLGRFLGRFLPFFLQLSKFGAVGILNTSIDFGVLNLFSLITGATAGIVIGGFNIPGQILAIANSYAWNKYWVFSQNGQNRQEQDLAKFLGVTIIGLVLNSTLVVVATTYVTPPFGLSGATWLNVAKIFVTLFTLIWNFLGYKFFVFVGK
ncbi:MAG: GtrA family protein [Candidatus Sungbacteria bacterium]|nr:GtrA family protein [Candidatus Sungbacteria bacterium]